MSIENKTTSVEDARDAAQPVWIGEKYPSIRAVSVLRALCDSEWHNGMLVLDGSDKMHMTGIVAEFDAVMSASKEGNSNV